MATDEYWIRIDVPVGDIQWLNIPGSAAEIQLDGARGTRNGTLYKMGGTLNAQSRLAQMIVSLPDPLLLKGDQTSVSPVVLGDYVRVKLTGKTLAQSVRLPQSVMRKNSTVWIERDGKLVIQPAQVVYQDRKFVYITSGLNEGDRLITSEIITPVEGMSLKDFDDADQKDSSDGPL